MEGFSLWLHEPTQSLHTCKWDTAGFLLKAQNIDYVITVYAADWISWSYWSEL